LAFDLLRALAGELEPEGVPAAGERFEMPQQTHRLCCMYDFNVWVSKVEEILMINKFRYKQA